MSFLSKGKQILPTAKLLSSATASIQSRSFFNFVQNQKVEGSFVKPVIHEKKEFVYPDSMAENAQTKITTLPSGLRVVTENTGHPLATIGLWIHTGSRVENDKNNGVAHFFEHMCFKGTPTRSQRDIELEIESMGAVLNAYTSREMTTYFSVCDRKDTGKALNIITDILQNSNLPTYLIERERHVIKREMEEVEKIPEEVIFDHLHAVAYKNSPLSRTILGPLKNIMSLTQKQMKEFTKSFYSADNIVVCAVGGVDHNELVDYVDKHCNSFPEKALDVKIDKSIFKGGEVRKPDRTMPYGHVGIAFEGVSWSDPNFFALSLAQQMIGSWNRFGGNSSNIYSPLAEKVASQELANSYMSFTTCYDETGLFGGFFTSDSEKLGDMVFAFQDELKRMAVEINEEDVERGKQQLKMQLMGTSDSTTATCEEMGRQVLALGRRLSPTEIMARIDTVTAQQVRSVLKEIISKEIALSAIGRIKELPTYEQICARQKFI